MIIVDTNVLSELMKASPEPAVREWVRTQDAKEMHTTAISLAEIGYGIARLPSGRRKDLLRTTADEVFGAFADKILAFDRVAAEHYATIVTTRDEAGSPIDGFDAQIAAICSVHHATLATRNLKDFRGTAIELTSPWSEAAL